ncbi:MAG: YbaB/EbfC family nucleoid-associated protein [Acholeplasmatales bacterium]|nr:YbaB/EbfC family nucleoid-associated protein [Acholeplasmatales bacterium]
MNNQMIQKLKRMQQELKAGQEKIEASEFEGSATGVNVVVLGNRTILGINIDDELLSDKDILQDSILVAINAALAKIDAALAELYKKFNVPGMNF